MGIKDDFISNIIRNEIYYRKKQKKTKGIFLNYNFWSIMNIKYQKYVV